jgi:DNA mismatch repair protein MSH6
MVVAEDLREAEFELEEYVRNQNNIVFIQWIESAQKWLQAVEALKLIDCLVSLSCYVESETDGMVIPNFEDSKDRKDALLELVKSRHPCVNLPAGQQLVANSANFGKKVMILTGPNMGGKSTIMRQVALNVVLAQMGSYVPAESLNLTPVDRIFTRIGGSDHMIKGESTFYVELNETASILQHATLNSFVIIDELGRGTATHDGCAIARAVYQELVEMNVMSIVSTHYHSLVEEIQKNKVDNLQLAFMDCHEQICPTSGKVVDVTCLFELAEGICPQSHGFACARKAFIAESMIEKGQRYATELEDITKVLTQITRMFS